MCWQAVCRKEGLRVRGYRLQVTGLEVMPSTTAVVQTSRNATVTVSPSSAARSAAGKQTVSSQPTRVSDSFTLISMNKKARNECSGFLWFFFLGRNVRPEDDIPTEKRRIKRSVIERQRRESREF